MGQSKLHKCIYCLHEKPEGDFNREHVVPRSFGRYENGYTLHEYQVCIECNTYFSKTFETSIGLDSFEGLLRMTKNKRVMSDGTSLNDERINIIGNSGAFKGIKFRVVTNQSTGERISFIPYPAIGLKLDEDKNEYEYFEPKKLPYKTQEIGERLKNKTNPIIYWNIEKEKREIMLSKKGYTYAECKAALDITEIYPYTTLETQINVTITPIVKRFVAKTVFNYLTFKFGKNYALLPQFDSIRKYIRYGVTEDTIRFKYSHGRVTNFSEEEDAHIVGLAWGDGGYNSIHGLVSWFNEASYTIWLCNNKNRLCYPLPISIFDNHTCKITDTEEAYVL